MDVLTLKVPVPLNRKQLYEFIEKTAYAKFVKCIPSYFRCLNLHIEVNEITPKLILLVLDNRIAILSDRMRSGTGTLTTFPG